MKIKKILVFLGVASLLAVFASCRHHNPEERAKWIIKKLSSELDLDSNQKQALEKIKNEFFEKRKNQKKPDRNELLSLIKSEKIDEVKVKKLVEEREANHKEMKDFFMKKAIEFHSTLKSDQKDKLANLVEKFMSKHDIDD
jgi:Spy/CpxP family protein refolding chaperone